MYVIFSIDLCSTYGVFFSSAMIQCQVETLTELNCDFIQGYYYSKPLPVAEFEAWRESYEKQRA